MRLPHVVHDLVLALGHYRASRVRVHVVDASVAQVGKLVPHLRRVVVLASESAVRLFVHPDDQRSDAAD